MYYRIQRVFFPKIMFDINVGKGGSFSADHFHGLGFSGWIVKRNEQEAEITEERLATLLQQ